MKTIDIEYLYLDLSCCQRCQGGDRNVDEAIKEITPILRERSYETTVNKINIVTEELANKYKFYSSPTIRINGTDILLNITENKCESCGSLCSDEIDCRTFTYKGEEYDVPPKAMIKDAIMDCISGNKEHNIDERKYILPENLKRFFDGKNNLDKIKESKTMKIEIFEKALCCETGVCGTDVDTELLRVTALVTELKAKGVDIDRANLSTRPERFISNAVISGLLKEHGVEILPVTILDGHIIVKQKAYPTDAEFEEMTGIKLSKGEQSSGCCCVGGKNNRNGCC